MILEFLDGSKMEVLSIFGGPRLINGVMRDTLRIEISPSAVKFEELRECFKNNPKTAMLYTYTEDSDTKNNIGEGYQIFVSISDEERKIAVVPGKMVPDEYEEVYVVTIAQMTYQEYTSTIPSVSNDETPPISKE